MTPQDRFSAKQSVVSAAQQAINVASIPNDLFEPGTQQYLLSSAVHMLSHSLSKFLEGDKSASKSTTQELGDPDDFVISMPLATDKCGSFMETIISNILKRWISQKDSYYKSLEFYYYGCEIDEEGEFVRLAPERINDPEPTLPVLSITREELERLKILAPHLSMMTDEEPAPSPWLLGGKPMTVEPDRTPSKKDSENDERDQWIYDHYVKGTKIGLIIRELKQIYQINKWIIISSPPGISQAAWRYAGRHGLPRPCHGQGVNHRLGPPGDN